MTDRRALVGAAGAVAYATAVLASDPFHGPVLCPLRRLTGLQCPGCGSTRASWSLLHGDVEEAVRHNALLLPAVVVLVAWWLHLVAPAATARLPGWLRAPALVPARAIAVVAFAAFGFGVLRNVAPFETWLAAPSTGS